MSTPDYQKIEAIVRKAGAMLPGASSDQGPAYKKQGDANFCTEYDLAIQKYLIGEFRALMPEAAYYGEEETEGNTQDTSADYVFYIDPIDGTTNFMKGYGHSCVSVGLSHKGKMLAGFVYDPFVDHMYVGIRGKGSTLNGRPLKVADLPISEGLAGFDATRYNEGSGPVIDVLFDLVKELFRRSLGTREGGSAALDLCRVASSANTVYVQFVLKPYDFAAASVIVEEAGGVLTQMDGSPCPLTGTTSMICGSPTAWAEAKALVAELLKKHGLTLSDI